MKVILSFENGQASEIIECSFLEILTSEKIAVVHDSAGKQTFNNVVCYEELKL